jgi:hypothetical protein
VQSIKLITRPASERVARYAFNYAETIGRKHVTCVHKAAIMKASDGLFLSACQEVAKEYPSIHFDDISLDNACLNVRHCTCILEFTKPLDCDEPGRVQGPRDGDAQLVWRYS